jgi:hypothetical protein
VVRDPSPTIGRVDSESDCLEPPSDGKGLEPRRSKGRSHFVSFSFLNISIAFRFSGFSLSDIS